MSVRVQAGMANIDPNQSQNADLVSDPLWSVLEEVVLPSIIGEGSDEEIEASERAHWAVRFGTLALARRLKNSGEYEDATSRYFTLPRGSGGGTLVQTWVRAFSNEQG